MIISGTTPFFKLASLFWFILSVIILLGGYYFLRSLWRKSRHLELEIQHLLEKINILHSENAQENKNKISLQEKIKRYDSLKGIIEEINQNLDLESIAETLVSIAFSSIGKSQGVCILYLVNERNSRLNIFKSKKEDKKLIIRAKEGDIFDFWVARHQTPLFIEDLHKDFRFDLERVKEQEVREVCSLISTPFVSEQRFLGLLRLDSPEVHFYTQDDLRFLVTLADLGAVALENGEYFQKAQHLAIHDGLTSLYKKGFFLERLHEECRRSLRRNSVLSLLLLDIDYFKKYNDQFGHTAGDLVLKTLSEIIRNFLKEKTSIASRFGGEEFCIVLPGIDKEKAFLIAEELRTRIERTKILLRRQETHITASIGVADFPFTAKAEVELIVRADKAMYEAKEKGRNRVVCA